MSSWKRAEAFTAVLAMALLAAAAPARAGFISQLVGPRVSGDANDVRNRLAVRDASGGAADVESGRSVEVEAWKPLRAFVGNWAGTRTSHDGTQRVTRGYGSTPDNRQLQFQEKVAGRTSAQGRIRYDRTKHTLVLEQSKHDGGSTELVLDEAGSSDTRIVFTTITLNPGQTRVVLERSSWNEFVERVEHAPMGQSFEVVTETRFKRKA